MAEELVLRVFTHPACSGCSQAVRRAWKLSEKHSEVTLRTVKLETKEGLAEARAAHIKTIPTIILSAAGEELERWVGTPEAGVLEADLEKLMAHAS